MKKMLEEIQNGTYAKKWIAENEAGRPWFNATRRTEREALIEKVGEQLRAMMPFLDAVTVTPEGEVKRAAAEPVFSACLVQGEVRHSEEREPACPLSEEPYRSVQSDPGIRRAILSADLSGRCGCRRRSVRTLHLPRLQGGAQPVGGIRREILHSALLQG